MQKRRLSDGSAARRTFGHAGLLGFVGLALCSPLLVACKKKPPVIVTVPESDEETVVAVPTAPPSAAPSAGPVATRCHESPAKTFTIGEVAPSRVAAEDDDAGGPDED